MKINKKLYSGALASAILFLILVSFTVSASPGEDLHKVPSEITSGAGDPSPDGVLSDGLSVERKSIVTAAPNFTETRINHDTSYQFSPAIYGNKIAWMDSRSEGRDIYMYNLSTSKEKRITVSGSAENLAIYGNRIVWEDDRNVDYDIYMYDLPTSTETQITTDGSDQGSPAIYGNRIVWTDDRNGNSDIYMYDLSTSTETQITTDGSDQYSPAIYGNRIVWMDGRNENYDIYIYDLSTSTETQITTDGSDQYSPAIYGNRIVWMDDRNGNFDIYVYDLTTREQSHTTNNLTQWAPDIYGDRIVWEDYRNGNRDIYMGTIITVPPIAAFSAFPTSGNTPLNVTFTDKSTRTPTGWKWDFGDGTNSTVKNPTHRYRAEGNYTVKLTATNDLGSNTTVKTNYIKVKAVTKPVANFTSSVTSGYAPLSVSFTDKSSGSPTAWKWTFGDGTNSTEQNPTHKYSKAGNYTVTLTASNSAGNNTMTKINYIKVKAVIKPVAKFTSNVTSGRAPLTVAFTDKSTNYPTSWKWTFGDGTNSTVKNPTHRYLVQGNYTVRLIVANNAGSNSTAKTNYINVTTNTGPGSYLSE